MSKDEINVERVDTLAKLPRRPPDAHKGDFGRVLIVGGSRGMVGAVALAANSALRGGAGLVTFAAPEPVQLTIAGLCPCATSVPLSCDGGGQLKREAVREMVDTASRCDVLALGPGMGVGPTQQNLIRAAIEQTLPLVMDADGLNNLSTIDRWTELRCAPAVLTPHPGEFARLTGTPTERIQQDRERIAVTTAQKWNSDGPDDVPLVLVLKGAGTVVTDGRRVNVNGGGNPGMATGGSGDVLTGLIAALIGQGLEMFEASCLGVFCHSRAGDLAAEKLGEISLIASDLLDFLPQAMREPEG